jgi:tetratricopeptide (TPR) repeat protein
MFEPAMTHLQPKFVESQMLADANRMADAGNFPGAAGVYNELLKRNPNRADLMCRMAVATRMLGQLREAHELIRRALRLQPANPEFHFELAQIHKRAERFDEALAAFDEAMRLSPGNYSVTAGKADLLFFIGRYEASAALLQPMIDSGVTDIAIAISYARVAPRIDREQVAAELLERALQTPNLTNLARVDALFRLGDLYDKLRQYDLAFARYREGNSLRYNHFDPAEFTRHVDALIRDWTPQRFAALPRAGGNSGRMVFVCGMPRSGTTLVEQIIASHPDVHGAGELNDIPTLISELQGDLPGSVYLLRDTDVLTRKAIDDGARAYLAMIQRLNRTTRYVTDKAPMNCFHLGLISVMLPQAKIIHCIRDPMDTCLSCYFQLFSGLLPFAYDLGHTGLFYRDYRRVMRHWRDVLHIPMLDVVYEELTADQEAGTRRLLEYLDLPWHDGCLQFHASERVAMTVSNEQVRRPMYRSSVQRWRHYERHLDPLKQALGDVIESPPSA